MNKRILVFSFAYYPFVGGAEVAIKEITDRLKDFEFDLLTHSFDNSLPTKEKIGNVTVIRIRSFTKFLYPIKSFLKASRLHFKNRYDLSWAVMANTGFASLFLKLFFGLPFILTIQEGDPIPQIKRRVWFVYPFFKMVFKMADKVTAISVFLADFAREMGAKNISVIPNGVDLEIFVGQPKTISDSKNAVLITTSRLVKKNGLADVIQALPLLPVGVTFSILGDGPLLDELKELSLKLNVSDRVNFMGFVRHEKAVDLLRSADVFIRPSLTEGLGCSFLEAMSVGLPLIATPVGGIPDFLKDGETGLFCDVNNPKDIADKVLRLMNDKELYKKISKNGVEIVREKYDWNGISSRFASIFSSVS